MVPLSPVGAFYLLDLPQEIEELHGVTREYLEAEGVGVVRLPEYDRAEWLGVFTYEVEIVLEVVMFWPAKGKTAEEVQASAAQVFYVLAGLVTVLVLGYVSDRTLDFLTDQGEVLVKAFPIVAIALGFLAIALLVREVRKAKALTHGT